MKKASYLLLMIAFASLVACNKISYQKTKSGLLYKIIPGSSKDSTKVGQYLKVNVIQKRNNDSVLQTTYGKMPVYAQIAPPPVDRPSYGPDEILHLLKKGDSAVIIMFVDSMLSKKIITDVSQIQPLKKGDKLTIYVKVLDVLKSDSAFQKDQQAEMLKDKPRREKEMAAEMEKRRKANEEAQAKELADLEKSGEAAKQRKVVEDYLKAHHITAQKTGAGTYVEIKQQGTGPQAAVGKYVTVKYSGRRLATDSVFEANTYPGLHLGIDPVIRGWDEGLQLFKEGGKGTIYIPAYLGYGSNPQPGSPIKVNDALIFDIEMLSVADEAAQQ